MSDCLPGVRLSMSPFARTVRLPPAAGSRIVREPSLSSATRPVSVRPSLVVTRTVSYPFLMTFDGHNTDSIKYSAVPSLPTLATSGPRWGPVSPS